MRSECDKVHLPRHRHCLAAPYTRLLKACLSLPGMSGIFEEVFSAIQSYEKTYFDELERCEQQLHKLVHFDMIEQSSILANLPHLILQQSKQLNLEGAELCRSILGHQVSHQKLDGGANFGSQPYADLALCEPWMYEEEDTIEVSHIV